MAISFLGSAEGSSSAIVPAHSAGDLILVWAFRDGSITPPVMGIGYTSIETPVGTLCSARIGYKIAQSDAETLGGIWSGSTSLIIAVYAGVDNADPIGGFATAVGTVNADFAIPEIPPFDHVDSTSWVVCGAGHRSTDTDIEFPPTGTTLRQNRLNATSEASLFDTNGPVSSWSAFSRTITGTASGWNTFALELNAASALPPEEVDMAITAAGDSFNYLRGPLADTAQGVTILGGAATEYPSGSTVLNASSGNVAAATATATLTSAASQTAYLTGFEVTGAGATAGAVVSVTVTGILGGTLTYTYTAATGATVANQPLIVEFSPPLPASATNTNIVVSCPSLGAGNTNNTVVAHGYRR